MEAGELVVTRRIDGVGKRVNVREFLRSLTVAENGRELLARAGIVGDLAVLQAEVEVRGSGGVKIGEVVEAITGDAEIPQRAVRVALGTRLPTGDVVSPLALDVLRDLRAARAPEPHPPTPSP